MNEQVIDPILESNQAHLERINLALSQGAIARARQLINEDLAAPDIAHLLSSVPVSYTHLTLPTSFEV